MVIAKSSRRRQTSHIINAIGALFVAALLIICIQVPVQAQDGNTSLDVLPDHLHYTDAPGSADESEIAGQRIHWWLNQAFDAYTQALADHRPTMVLFSARPCGFCKTMAEKFQCPALVRYAGEMEFAITFRHEDEGGDHLAAALNVQRYPTTVMLLTDMDKLHVVGRIEGVFSAPEIGNVIAEGFKDVATSGLRPKPDLPSVEDTRASLDKAGIAHPSEAFCAQSGSN